MGMGFRVENRFRDLGGGLGGSFGGGFFGLAGAEGVEDAPFAGAAAQ